MYTKKSRIPIMLLFVTALILNCSDTNSVEEEGVEVGYTSIGGVELQTVSSAAYSMASGAEARHDLAVHVVYVDSFYVDKYEVSQKEYTRLMGVNPSSFKTDEDSPEYPVENVTWSDAALYCNERSKEDGLDTVYSYIAVSGIIGDNCELEGVTIRYDVLGYRLPTEAEWELAARGKYYTYEGSKEWYQAGYTIDDVAWSKENSGEKTQKVGSLKENFIGTHDMLGNVWEWCNDLYSSSYYDVSPLSNPIGPLASDTGSTGTKGHVRRGGSWYDESYELSTTWRLNHAATYSNVGFRVVLPMVKKHLYNPLVGMTLVEVDSIASLYVGTTEVSQKDFYSTLRANNSSNNGDSNPVEMVSWGDAALYCNELSKSVGLELVYSYSSIGGEVGNGCTLNNLTIDHTKKGFRLPTEDEFRALVGSSTTATVISIENGTGKPGLVVSAVANEFGLYNMKGNVWEWVEQEDFVTTSRMGGGYETTLETINELTVNNKSAIAIKSVGFRVVLEK